MRATGTTKPQKGEMLALVGVLLLSALLRTGWPGIVEFKLDEANLLALAMDLVEGRSVPLQGTGTSFGLPTSPLSVYIYALPVLLWRNALWVTWFTGALNVVATALCWKFVRRYWGAVASLFAALLFATHPWAVHFSRKIWEPNLLPFLSLCWAITAALAFFEHGDRALPAHLGFLSVAAQVHFSGLALVPVSGLLILLHWRQLRRRQLLVGVLLAAALALPYALHVARGLNRPGWIYALRSAPVSTASRLDLQSARLWWSAASGSDIHALTGWLRYRDFQQTLPQLPVQQAVLGLLVVSGVLLCLHTARQRASGRRAGAALLVALWTLAPLLLLTWRSGTLYLHYYVVSLPAMCIAAGLALGRAIEAARQRQLLHALTVALTVALALAQTITVAVLLHLVDADSTPGGFGLPLHYQLRAVEEARARGDPVWVLAPSDDIQLSDWTSSFDALLRHVPHRLIDGSRVAAFSDRPVTALLTPDASVAERVYAEAGLLELADVLPNRAGEPPFYLLPVQGTGGLGLSFPSEQGLLANGVQLLGDRALGSVAAGETFEWWVGWQVQSTAPLLAKHYHTFNHLLDAEGVRWAQADGPSGLTAEWQSGDVVVQSFWVTVPADAGAGPFSMRVGMYTYPEVENVPFLDAEGHPAGEAMVLGPLSAQQ